MALYFWFSVCVVYDYIWPLVYHVNEPAGTRFRGFSLCSNIPIFCDETLFSYIHLSWGMKFTCDEVKHLGYDGYGFPSVM